MEGLRFDWKSVNSEMGMDSRVLLIWKRGRVFLDGLRKG